MNRYGPPGYRKAAAISWNTYMPGIFPDDMTPGKVTSRDLDSERREQVQPVERSVAPFGDQQDGQQDSLGTCLAYRDYPLEVDNGEHPQRPQRHLQARPLGQRKGDDSPACHLRAVPGIEEGLPCPAAPGSSRNPVISQGGERAALPPQALPEKVAQRRHQLRYRRAARRGEAPEPEGLQRQGDLVVFGDR